MTSNTACNINMCTVMNAENGSQEPNTRTELDKELDVTGIRNVHCVKTADTANE